ncbi:MAG TPA: hypothetical protein ENI62_06155 [Gammaproteobacteria bacterium]|nr:hypothetical protein [Gammaproteobacteria bacterium]
MQSIGSMVEDLYAIALAYYRAPLNYPGLSDPSRALAEDLGDFLESSGGEELSQSLLAAAEYLGVSGQELSQAALFYIKQVLFADGADYYRNLGLPPTAAVEEIKRHHRLLIRIFHPDREARNREWNESYAPRVIEAYNSLNKPNKRSDYDRQLLQQRNRADTTGKRQFNKAGFHHQVPGPVVAQHDYAVLQHTSLPKTRPWYLRAGMLLLFGLLITAGVLLSLYYKIFEGPALLSNASSSNNSGQLLVEKPSSTPVDPLLPLASTENPFAEKMDLSKEELASILAGRVELERNSAKKASAVKKRSQPTAHAVVPEKIKARSVRIIKARREAISIAKANRGKTTPKRKRGGLSSRTATRKSIVSKQERKSQPVVASNSASTSIAEKNKPVEVRSGSEQKIVGEVTTSATTAKQVAADSTTPADLNDGGTSANDSLPVIPLQANPRSFAAVAKGGINNKSIPVAALGLLLGNLMQTYHEGDLDAFADLFAKDARSAQASGRDNIRRDYARLFRNSASRTLLFKDMRWQRRADGVWYGAGQFEVIITDQLASNKKHLVGSATLTIIASDKRLKISEFNYQVQSPTQVHALTEEKPTPESSPEKSATDNALLPQQDLARFLEQFVQSYEQADLERFMELFAKMAKTNKAQGRENIRQNYRKFFANSQSRKLTITQIVWKRTTVGSLRGEGNIEVSARTGVFNVAHHYSGNVQFTLKRGKDGLQITEFFYRVQ